MLKKKPLSDQPDTRPTESSGRGTPGLPDGKAGLAEEKYSTK
jgi:hypothetical protein